MRVLAVSGSLRAGSYNTLLLEEAAAAAPAGVELELFDSSLLGELPAYDQLVHPQEGPDAARRPGHENGDGDGRPREGPGRDRTGEGPGGHDEAAPKLVASAVDALLGVGL